MFYVELPTKDGQWDLLDSFKTKEEALAICKKLFASEDGTVNLITELKDDEEDDDDDLI
jgi:hypothetical protein